MAIAVLGALGPRAPVRELAVLHLTRRLVALLQHRELPVAARAVLRAYSRGALFT